MKTKMNDIGAFGVLIAVLIILFTSCQEDVVEPERVPIKAEIKQIIINNSVSNVVFQNKVETDMDTITVTVPQGTDVSQLDLDILVNYFGTLEPEAGITDLTNPIVYTVTSNTETRQFLVQSKIVPPSISTFVLTSPVEAVGTISGDSIILEILEGIDLSAAMFTAEAFGESIVPDPSGTIDLTVDSPTLKVINRDFEAVYNIYIEYYNVIEFTGAFYDGTVHPNVFLPGSVANDEADRWVVESNPAAYGGSVVHFTSLGDFSGSAAFDYGDLGLDDSPDEVTSIFRVKGIPDAGENYLEIAFKIGDLRAKFYLEKDNIEIKGGSNVKINFADWTDFDPTAWNTYRVTMNKITRSIVLYVNEEQTPVLETTLKGNSGDEIDFGDGGGGLYECLIDYIAIETTGAFTPEDLPLSKILQ